MRGFVASVIEALRPRYSELTTYLTALTCVLLAFTYPELGPFLGHILSGAGSEELDVALAAIILVGIAAVGFVLSILHVSTKRKKAPWERTCMGVFAAGANGLAGILAGIEMLSSRSTVLTFFPLWNIAVGASLLYQIGLNRVEVTDEDAGPLHVLGASIVLLIVFAICALVWRLSWALTFSICMFYSSIFVLFVSQVTRLLRSRGILLQ